MDRNIQGSPGTRGRFETSELICAALPAPILAGTWLALGMVTGTWDIESLSMGLGWVFVAQVGLLAHIRRSRSAAPYPQNEGRGVRADAARQPCFKYLVAACIAAAIAACVLLDVWPSTVVLGILGSLGAMYGTAAVFRRRQGASMPWSALAIGLTGIAVALLQLPVWSAAEGEGRGLLVAGAFALALVIWIGTLVRDVRVVLSGP